MTQSRWSTEITGPFFVHGSASGNSVILSQPGQALAPGGTKPGKSAKTRQVAGQEALAPDSRAGSVSACQRHPEHTRRCAERQQPPTPSARWPTFIIYRSDVVLYNCKSGLGLQLHWGEVSYKKAAGMQEINRPSAGSLTRTLPYHTSFHTLLHRYHQKMSII